MMLTALSRSSRLLLLGLRIADTNAAAQQGSAIQRHGVVQTGLVPDKAESERAKVVGRTGSTGQRCVVHRCSFQRHARGGGSATEHQKGARRNVLGSCIPSAHVGGGVRVSFRSKSLCPRVNGSPSH